MYLKSLFFLFLISQHISLPAQEEKPSIRVICDYNNLKAGEVFVISYQTTVIPEKFIEPDLKSFLVKTPRQVKEISLVSTSNTGEKEHYHFSFYYEVQAEESGTYIIPPAEMIYQGETYKSKSKKIVVYPRIPLEQIKHTVSVSNRPVILHEYLWWRLRVSFNEKPDAPPVFEWPAEIVFSEPFSEPSFHTSLSIVDGQRISSYSYDFIFMATAVGSYTLPATTILFNGQEYTLDAYTFEITLTGEDSSE